MDKQHAIGIIAEYNPFHNGHSWQLQQAQLAFGQRPILAVMSGNFMQRGTPALADKWARAALAVANGVDLVLELPTIFACRSAEHFARGAVQTLIATGCVSSLAFGCETEDYALLNQAANFSLENEGLLKAQLQQGHSYAAANQQVLAQLDPRLALISKSPNNILALEYLKQLTLNNSSIQPLPQKRHEAHYHDELIGGGIASATAIRKEIFAQGFTPLVQKAVAPTTYATLQELSQAHRLGINEQTLELVSLFTLRSLTAPAILSACECSEGLENKFHAAAGACSLAAVLAQVKSKRYPASRIQRLLLQLLLSTPTLSFKQALTSSPSYLRVLAFNDTGRQLLKTMQTTATLPVLTKLGRHVLTDNKKSADFINALQLDITATNLYNFLQNKNFGYATDYTTSPLYCKG
ncbi:MAG: nucleotidyltransferase family protein [Acidaminococcaceae bacterium]